MKISTAPAIVLIVSVIFMAGSIASEGSSEIVKGVAVICIYMAICTLMLMTVIDGKRKP